MDRFIKQPLAPTLGALAVARILLDVGDHTGIENALAIVGSVLDVEMTMLDKQSKGVPIDEQANDDVVHLDRFREADRLTDQRLIRVRSVRCVRSIFWVCRLPGLCMSGSRWRSYAPQ